mgnify:CR=1 FL=1
MDPTHTRIAPRTRNPIRVALPLLLAATLGGAPFSAAAAGRTVPNFNLLDLAGRDHELYRAEARVVVLFFTGTGCPIARKSTPKLREIRKQFGPRGVQVWGVNSYPDDSARDALKEYHELGLQPMTYLRDTRQGVALALEVQRTAEVVAIETSQWRVLYQGAIDDQFVEGGEIPAPRQQYLAEALEGFLSDKPVPVARTRSRGCRIAYAEGPAVPSYARDVAPLLQRHCVECHRDGAIAPWAMDGHGRVRNYARMIEEVLLTRRMPPWDPHPDFGTFANGNTLRREDTQTLIRWVQAGAPRDEGTDPLAEPLPPRPDWVLGRPDVILRLPEPQEVPATGVVDYRLIRVPNPFDGEVWIRGTEIRPGNRRVVHHSILYGRWPGAPDDGTGNGAFLCGWAPGSPPQRFPEGVAQRLPKDAELHIEMHYTTCGSPQTDQTEIALFLAPGPQPREASVRAAVETDINIPPGVDEARHVATYAFARPATLYTLVPHMHVRGDWMKYELLLPDGTRETLLHVPRYDFKWQYYYELARPRLVPAGAWLLVTGAYDNSTAKPGNPDPGARVRAGLQSWDEMFIGFFTAADEP